MSLKAETIRRPAAPPPIPAKFFTVPEAAALLSVSPRTLYDLVRKGSLPAHRFLGTDSIRISDRDLAAYIEGSRVSAN